VSAYAYQEALPLVPAYGPRQRKISQLEPFERFLRERLGAVPELTGRRLHRELAAVGYTGGYTAVTELLREIRPAAAPGFEVRFETPPGRQAQVDFAHFRTEFTDEPGVERVVWLFSPVLGHSRMLWGRFVPPLWSSHTSRACDSSTRSWTTGGW